MARRSSIERLPPDILEQLQYLLRDPRVAQMEAVARINDILAERGEDPVSKSAVNRYSVKMEEVGAELRHSREVAEMWIAKLGAIPQGQIGHLTNEIIRTLSFDLSLMIKRALRGELDIDEMPAAVRMVKELAIAQEKLERAASENVKREQDIKRQAAEEIAAMVDNEANGGSVTPERLREIMRASYGV